MNCAEDYWMNEKKEKREEKQHSNERNLHWCMKIIRMRQRTAYLMDACECVGGMGIWYSFQSKWHIAIQSRQSRCSGNNNNFVASKSHNPTFPSHRLLISKRLTDFVEKRRNEKNETFSFCCKINCPRNYLNKKMETYQKYKKINCCGAWAWAKQSNTDEADTNFRGKITIIYVISVSLFVLVEHCLTWAVSV